MQRRVAESLQVGNPKSNANSLPDQVMPANECPIVVRVDEVRTYEDNPRRTRNPRFDEIKESIRSGGIRTPLTVTRRPGSAHYITEAGGNTRLLAAQELWAETRDPRFEKITVVFRPWRSESHVLSAHLIENDLRGDMGFWDKAIGISALKSKIEGEQGRTLSTRQFDDELRALGLTVNLSTLTHCLFATSRLRTLGEGIVDLTGLHVRQLQPHLNVLKRYAQMRGSSGEAELYASVFEPVFVRHVARWMKQGRFDAETLCRDCDEALAAHLGERVEKLRVLLEIQARSPQSTIEDLLAQADAEEQAADPGAAVLEPRGPEPRASIPGSLVVPEKPQPAPSPNSIREPLMRCVARCAELTGVQHYVRLCADAPLGYYMDVPATALDPMQRRAWWLFVLLAGQLGRPNATLNRPFNWAAELASAITLDRTLLDWLLDGNDPAAATIWELVVLAKAARSTRSPLDGAGAS
jgi:ParB family protein of integrating conjugative element (PFGI_1 class)